VNSINKNNFEQCCIDINAHDTVNISVATVIYKTLLNLKNHSREKEFNTFIADSAFTSSFPGIGIMMHI